MENFERELKNLAFPNYEKFSDINSAYNEIVNKITQVINNLAPYKTIRVKNQSNEWFDGELAEQISNRDKLFKKSKKSKLHINELIYKEAKNTVQCLKNFGKTFKNLAFLKQRTPPTNICLKENDSLSFCSLSIANNFKEFFQILHKT